MGSAGERRDGEAEIQRTKVQGQSRQIVQVTPIFKITRAKWTGDVA
jgi:hypothetical protein